MFSTTVLASAFAATATALAGDASTLLAGWAGLPAPGSAGLPAQMSPRGFLVHTLNGLYFGFILFMIAAGLTIIFGVLGILNLTHGELYAFGAYTTVTVMGFLVGLIPPPTDPATQLLFVAVVVLGAILAAAIVLPLGVIIESVFVRQVYDRHEVYQLLLTFGLLFVLIDTIKLFWGTLPRNVGAVYRGVNAIPTTELVGFSYPSYQVFVMFIGLIVFAVLVWFFDRTKTGRIVRATAINREMSTAIGVSTNRVFTLVFGMGAFFAGFAGAMFIGGPAATDLEMGLNPLVLSFVIIVIGGLGSLQGAFVAAILVGVVSRWMTAVYPPAELAAPFLIMIIVLLVKPEGLFGTWGEIE